jgi:hypothetical protein
LTDSIVARLNSEVVRILALPDVKQQLDGLGAEAYGSTVESMRQFIREDRQRWARLVKEQNFKVERLEDRPRQLKFRIAANGGQETGRTWRAPGRFNLPPYRPSLA